MITSDYLKKALQHARKELYNARDRGSGELVRELESKIKCLDIYIALIKRQEDRINARKRRNVDNYNDIILNLLNSL